MNQDDKKIFALDDEQLEQVSGGTSGYPGRTCPKCQANMRPIFPVEGPDVGKVIYLCFNCKYQEEL